MLYFEIPEIAKCNDITRVTHAQCNDIFLISTPSYTKDDSYFLVKQAASVSFLPITYTTLTTNVSNNKASFPLGR